ncbi:Uncharacterised protein [Mycoplasmopsis edwardii]|uniref:Uncharacterized protein n=1 Tax=Mycoplasmopsis edwardii TaxID=53558 RepID=A0A3B0QAR5_9BACT|nr:Uncharacterised protein [Mycoplasmopsis edwardii]
MKISPFTVSPALAPSLAHEPNWNQNKLLGMWCNPNGINKRLINPYTPIIEALVNLVPSVAFSPTLVASERALEIK